MSKNKKSKKSKPVKTKSPFESGLDAEQALADSLCDQFLKGEDQEAIDEAFIGAFKGLGHRMLTIFNKEFVFELLEEVSNLDEEHVCNECKEEKLPADKTTFH